MHRLSSHFVLGYHGCDTGIAERLLAGEAFVKSEKEWDWLGPGVYFWEASPRRGLDWAIKTAARPRSSIEVPSVVGAVIDLGHCLDLMDQGSIDLVRDGYDSLEKTFELAGEPMPTNSGGHGLRRRLDCAVIRRVHSIIEPARIDTVRGVFTEGEPIYPGAGFDAKTHIQICVCNPDCIKGVFRVPPDQLRPAPVGSSSLDNPKPRP